MLLPNLPFTSSSASEASFEPSAVHRSSPPLSSHRSLSCRPHRPTEGHYHSVPIVNPPDDADRNPSVFHQTTPDPSPAARSTRISSVSLIPLVGSQRVSVLYCTAPLQDSVNRRSSEQSQGHRGEVDIPETKGHRASRTSTSQSQGHEDDRRPLFEPLGPLATFAFRPAIVREWHSAACRETETASVKSPLRTSLSHRRHPSKHSTSLAHQRIQQTQTQARTRTRTRTSTDRRPTRQSTPIPIPSHPRQLTDELPLGLTCVHSPKEAPPRSPSPPRAPGNPARHPLLQPA